MADAGPGTPVTSANPNTTTNTSLVAALATTTPGQLNVITISGLASGTGINPTMATPSGWVKVREQMSNSGTPSTFVGLYWRIYQTGDGSSVTFTWTNAGQMVADCVPFSNPDPTTPVPYSTSIPHAPGAGATYAIADTTGAAAGLLVYGGANKTGTAWSNLTDNDAGQRGLSSSATMCQRITATELAGGTAYSKTMTGSSSTIGVQWAFVVKAAPSALTGSAALTGAGQLSVAGVPTVPLTAPLAGDGVLTAAGTGSQAGSTSAALTGGGALAATGGGVLTAGSAAFTGAGGLAVVGQTSIMHQLLTGGQQFVAHRGGYASTFGECTLRAYQAAAAQYSKALLEIPVWRSSDGIYYCLHDRTTGSRSQYTGPSGNVDVTTVSSTVLDQYVSVVGGNPLARLTDVLDALPGRCFVIDNKQDTNAAALISVLEGRVSGRWMGKQYYTAAGTWLTACQNAGVPVWVYFYQTDLGSLATALAALSAAKSLIVFGLGDYSAGTTPAQSDADTFYAFVVAHGLMAWAHILSTTAQRSTADAQAAADSRSLDGYMVTGFSVVAPSDGALATLTGGGSLTSVVTPSESGTAAFTGSGQIGAVALLEQSAAASLVGAGTLTAAGGLLEQVFVALTGAGLLEVHAGLESSVVAALEGVGALAVPETGGGSSVGVSLGGAGVLESPLLEPANVVVGSLTGLGVLTVAGVGLLERAAVMLAGEGVLFAAGAGGSGGVAVLTGSGDLEALAGVSGAAVAALTGGGALVLASEAAVQAVAALGGVGLLEALDVPLASVALLGEGLGSLVAAGQAVPLAAVALAGEGSLVADGQFVAVVAWFDGSLIAWRLAVPRWGVRAGPDRWLVEAGLARWGWRDREDELVKVTDTRLVALQVQSPIDLRDGGVTITACVSSSPAVPDAPNELPIVLPASYEWPGPAGWATVHAWVGPGLPLGTAYVLTHVVAGGEDFWDVAASMQVEG